MALSVVLDTDIGSDVDDALALALLLRHPGFDLRAVTTVSGETARRAKIARKLTHLAGRDDVEVAAGLRGEQSQPGRSAEGGHEDAMLGEFPAGLDLSPRGAIDVLSDLLGDGQTELATVGMQSNLAALVEASPEIVERAALVTVMGGFFQPVSSLGRDLSPSYDHNLNVDQRASLVSLNAAFSFLYIPVDVSVKTWLLRRHVDALRGGDALCRELARQIDVQRGLERHLPEDHMCQLHDPLAVACMVERRFVQTRRARVSVAMRKGIVRTFIDPIEGTDAEIVTDVDGPAFADWWLEAVLRP
jgi:purine nucleosidase